LAPGADGSSRSVGATETGPALQVCTTVFFHGGSQSHFVMPAFTSPLPAQAAARLVSEGLHWDRTAAADGRHITGSLRAPGLQVVLEDRVLAVHDVTARTDVSAGYRQPGHSDTSVRVGSIAVTSRPDTQAIWAITGGAARATTTAAGGTLQAVAD